MRVVAFDLGNVLVDYRPRAIVAALARAAGVGALEAPLWETIFGGGTPPARPASGGAPEGRPESLKGRLDRGVLSLEEIRVGVNATTAGARGWPLDSETFARSWLAAVTARPGAAALVERVAKRARIAVWSNTDPTHFAGILRAIPPLQGAVHHVSFAAGVLKPAPVFFRGALATLGPEVGPASVTFVDDREDNVAAAQALGIDAFAAGTLEEVERGLVARGLA